MNRSLIFILAGAGGSFALGTKDLTVSAVGAFQSCDEDAVLANADLV